MCVCFVCFSLLVGSPVQGIVQSSMCWAHPPSCQPEREDLPGSLSPQPTCQQQSTKIMLPIEVCLVAPHVCYIDLLPLFLPVLRSGKMCFYGNTCACTVLQECVVCFMLAQASLCSTQSKAFLWSIEVTISICTEYCECHHCLHSQNTVLDLWSYTWNSAVIIHELESRL